MVVIPTNGDPLGPRPGAKLPGSTYRFDRNRRPALFVYLDPGKSTIKSGAKSGPFAGMPTSWASDGQADGIRSILYPNPVKPTIGHPAGQIGLVTPRVDAHGEALRTVVRLNCYATEARKRKASRQASSATGHHSSMASSAPYQGAPAVGP